MTAFLSPAKNMVPMPPQGRALSRPRAENRTRRLYELLYACSPWELESLLGVSPELGLRAFACYHDFASAGEGAALLSYRGLAYRHMAACDFTPEDLDFAQEHLRVFSAFYGPLRPLDAIRPHRLEMQSRLRPNGETLYRFWSDAFYRDVFASGDTAVNLASGEYARCVLPFLQPGDRLVGCSFLSRRRGKLVCLPTAAKMARGAMARFIVKNRLTRPEELADFGEAGFTFSPGLSNDGEYVFLQD